MEIVYEPKGFRYNGIDKNNVVIFEQITEEEWKERQQERAVQFGLRAEALIEAES